MRPFTENPEGRWLPARHNLAAFRLFASIMLMLRRPPAVDPESDHRTAYVIDRHQSALENFTVAALVNGFMTACLAAWLQPALPPWAFVLMLPLLFVAAPGVYQLFFHPLGLLLALLVRGGIIGMSTIVRIQTWSFYLLLSGVALVIVQAEGWIHWAGIVWLALLGVNGAAAVVMLALSPFVKTLEERMGGGSFDVSYWDSAA